MGDTFWILIWDGYGCGLDLIMPRLYEVYDQERVHKSNSFPYRTESDIEDFLKAHRIRKRFEHFKVIT
jgi:hypothetical protein